MLFGRATLREARRPTRLTQLRSTGRQPILPRLTRSTAAKRSSRRGLAVLDPRLSQVFPVTTQRSAERRRLKARERSGHARFATHRADSVALLLWTKSGRLVGLRPRVCFRPKAQVDRRGGAGQRVPQRTSNLTDGLRGSPASLSADRLPQRGQEPTKGLGG